MGTKIGNDAEDGVHWKMKVWASAALVPDQIGKNVYQSTAEVSAKI